MQRMLSHNDSVLKKFFVLYMYMYTHYCILALHYDNAIALSHNAYMIWTDTLIRPVARLCVCVGGGGGGGGGRVQSRL